eukprot:scaffold12412_cov145-Skeletonema_marinoi.AAC.2
MFLTADDEAPHTAACFSICNCVCDAYFLSQRNQRQTSKLSTKNMHRNPSCFARGYHIRLSLEEKNNQEQGSCVTWRQYQADAREQWARHVKDTDGWLYAIQTLRNAMTAQSFLASTVLSLLTLITGKVWDILRSASNKWDRRLLIVQLLTISATMLFSANQFLQGVRLMTHAGFMFPVKNDTKVDNIMRKTESCQWLGLRSMYISLAPIAWVVGGGRAFFSSSVALILFFRQIDKKPEGLGYEEFQASYI